MREITINPLTAAAFAPYGDVIEAPARPGRRRFDEALANLRHDARPGLALSRTAPSPAGTVVLHQMERHAFSSQSFVALAGSRWMVAVAPHGPDGKPDTDRLEAFVAGPFQGITIRADTWHAPMTVFDAEALFAVFMWRDGSEGDEEFVPVEPVGVLVPEKADAA